MERGKIFNKHVLILVVVVALFIILIASSGSNPSAFARLDNAPVSASFISRLHIPENISAAVGIGSAENLPKAANALPLAINGKPAVVYIGADYCPNCAAERWAIVIALLRFGNFTTLHYMTSSASDSDPYTPTFTFYNSTYKSNYITFVGVETTKNYLVNGTYPALQTPNSTESAILDKFDPQGLIPFLDFGNRTIIIGANYNPMVLDKNWSEIADELYSPNTQIAGSIIGSANLLTAQICVLTNNSPASACDYGYIKSLERYVQ